MHPANKWYLFKVRRYVPIFIIQFLAAFNDNIFKMGLIILFTYQLSSHSSYSVESINQIAGAVFILPFFLFTPLAGELADKFEKGFLVKCTKIVEIILGVFAFIAFGLGSLNMLMGILFLLGVHSAFFGPLKYSIIAQQLSVDELLPGNSFMEASTFISILLGTAVGGTLVVASGGTILLPALFLTLALSALVISYSIPKAPSSVPHLKIHWNVFAVAWSLQKKVASDRRMGACMYGITWMWVVSSVLLYTLPAINKDIMHAESSVTTLVFLCFSIGLAVGSLLCNKVLHGEIKTNLVAPIIAVSGLLLLDLAWITQYMSNQPAPETLMNISEFVAKTQGMHFLLVSIAVSICAGFFSVPLYAQLQHLAPPQERGRVIAALNVNNAFFMTLSGILSALAFSQGVSVAQWIALSGILCFGVAYWLYPRLK